MLNMPNKTTNTLEFFDSHCHAAMLGCHLDIGSLLYFCFLRLINIWVEFGDGCSLTFAFLSFLIWLAL
eukprot:m.67760 g.67760  ORF g.67760 m.67760 type:complete len:68 (-) comp12170_c0_seq1:2424-2627(-)